MAPAASRVGRNRKMPGDWRRCGNWFGASRGAQFDDDAEISAACG
jgi:hypothetical protein